VLPEALEKWSVNMMQNMLPRHMDLIYHVNHVFMEEIGKRYPGDGKKKETLSCIEGWEEKRVRMANLAIICSHNVNGVAALHTEILKRSVFLDFYQMWPHKFLNMIHPETLVVLLQPWPL